MTTAEPLVRSNREFVTPAQLQALLKNNLGLNARQVTVKKRSSTTYLTITVRDASADLAKVKAFARQFNTWTMDNTDYCEGQSVDVATTKEVDVAHAAPFIDEIKRVTATMSDGKIEILSNGKELWFCDREFYVKAVDDSGARGCYIRSYEVKAGTDWAIAALALQAARVGAVAND
jgi:hypothetical protein